MPADLLVLLVALFFVAAALYASVGFGGGSAYLAFLTLASVPLLHVAPVALVCNVIVVAGGSWQFVRAGHLRPRLLVPFLVTSIPAALWGGYYRSGMEALGQITGLALLAAAAALLLRDVSRRSGDASPSRRRLWTTGPVLGAALGALSGLIGIGGGIFLAPVLHLLGWGTAQQVAAVASVFILVNSMAGLAGQAGSGAVGPFLWAYLPLFVAVFAGGQIGSRLGAWRLSASNLRRLTGLIVLAAAINLLLRT